MFSNKMLLIIVAVLAVLLVVLFIVKFLADKQDLDNDDIEEENNDGLETIDTADELMSFKDAQGSNSRFRDMLSASDWTASAKGSSRKQDVSFSRNQMEISGSGMPERYNYEVQSFGRKVEMYNRGSNNERYGFDVQSKSDRVEWKPSDSKTKEKFGTLEFFRK